MGSNDAMGWDRTGFDRMGSNGMGWWDRETVAWWDVMGWDEMVA